MQLFLPLGKVPELYLKTLASRLDLKKRGKFHAYEKLSQFIPYHLYIAARTGSETLSFDINVI
jgi:hypothetical protein